MRDSCWERYTWPLSRAHVTWERMKRYTARTTWDRAENGRLRRNVGLGHRRASSQCWLHGCDRSVSLESEISSSDSQPRFIQIAVGSGCSALRGTNFPALMVHFAITGAGVGCRA